MASRANSCKTHAWFYGTSYFFVRKTLIGLWYHISGLAWFRGTFWYAIGPGQAIFGLSIAYVHIVQLVVHGDNAPNNSGLFLYSEIGVSLVLLGLLLAYKVLDQRVQIPQVAPVLA